MTGRFPSRGVLTAEWRKLSSLPSTYLILAGVAVLALVVGDLNLASVGQHWATMPRADRAGFDPVGESLLGLQFGELALAALGVLASGSEYGTGLIQATFTATPRRGLVFAAKAMVLAALILIFGELLALACVASGQAVLAAAAPAGVHLGVGLGDPGVLRAVGAAGCYLAVVTLVGFGIGAVLRHSAAALATAFALVFLAWPVARAFEGFSTLPDRLLLVNAADVLTAVRPVTGPNPTRIPSMTFAVVDLVLYLAVFLGLGAWRMRRDP